MLDNSKIPEFLYQTPVRECGVCHCQDRREVLCTDCRYPPGEFKFSLVQCTGCQTVYLVPRPARTLFSYIYPEDTYYAYSTHPQSVRSRLKAWAMQTLAAPSSIRGLPANGPRKFEYLLARGLLAQTMTVLPSHKQGRLLDVGCGDGELLRQANMTGQWEGFGVELSGAVAERARQQGLNVFCGELSQARFPNQFFDTVVLSHVIEHLEEPRLVLEECRRILKDDGWLIVVTPNYACFDRVTFGRYWKNLLVPQHLWFFTPITLAALLKRTGFSVQSQKYALLPKKRDELAAFSFRFAWADRGRLGMVQLAAIAFRAAVRTFVFKPVLYLGLARREFLGDTMTFEAVKHQ